MSRWQWMVSAVVVGLLLIWMSTTGTRTGASSVLSRGSSGWLGFQAALKLQDQTVRLSKAPWTELQEESRLGEIDPSRMILVTAFPWQRPVGSEEPAALTDFLRAGGTVWVGYSGRPNAFEQMVLEGLGVEPGRSLRSAPPLSPQGWWQYRTDRWTLHPEPPASHPPLEIAAFDFAPGAPRGAEVHFRAGEADKTESRAAPVVFSYPRMGGRVVVFPAALWSNGEILAAGNSTWLGRMVGQSEVDQWWIDEYHHGLIRADLARESSVFSWDTFMLHLLVIYGLGIWAVARRFGPVWQERAPRFGSTAEFLEGVGVLHHDLGHHRDAARRMQERVAELYPQGKSGPLPEPSSVDDGEELVRFAEQLSRHQ